MPMKRIKMATVMLMMEAVVSRSSTICGIEGRNEDDEKAADGNMDPRQHSRRKLVPTDLAVAMITGLLTG
ncbi:MAG: hypothetical protein LBE64_22440 [Acinetobacter pittii]|jgi:hypothetical protein|nr:hypothetical protein [Acinetobacter pittii]